jgi:hypothetical protein
MRSRILHLAPPLATATLALATVGWAATGDVPFLPVDRTALAVTAQATGPLVANDREGGAILSAAALAPGQTTSGEVTIRNAGDAAGAFTLSSSAGIDSGAPAAGPLSGVLDLAITDVTGATPVPLFAGKLATLPRVALGTFAAGAQRRYRFELTYPNGPAVVNNAYQGASASIRFDWDAVAVGGSARPTPTPLPGASGTGATQPAAGSAAAPARGASTPARPGSTSSGSAGTATVAGANGVGGSVAVFRVALGGARKPFAKRRLVTWMSSTTASKARITGTVSFAGRRLKLRPATVKLQAKRRTVRLRLPAAAVRPGAKRRLTVRLTVTATAGTRKATIRRTLRVTAR